MQRKRVVYSSSEDESGSSPRRKRHIIAHDEGNVGEDLVGRRLRFKRDRFVVRDHAASQDDEYLLGTCEAYSPARKAALIVFDDPFGPRFDRFRDKSDKPRAIPSRLSVALWNEPDAYLQYDSGEVGWGGSCTVRKSRSKREACYWWAAWLPLPECLATGVSTGLEPLLCLCRRVEVAEPPPPLLIKAGLAPKPTKEEEDKSALVECEGCKEWFHLECAGMVAKRVPNPDERWRCPLCEKLIDSPRLSQVTSAISPAIKEEKLSAWLHESQQPLWRSQPPLQWQWWSNGSMVDASHAAGEWVFALCTLRRFVTSKSVQDSLPQPDNGMLPMWYCLNRSFPVASKSRDEANAAHLQWALLMDDLRRAEPIDSAETESVASAPVSEGSIRPASSSALKARPAASKVWSIPSRMRSYEEHMEVLDSRRFSKTKKKKRSGNGGSHSGTAVVEDAQGRNQRLEIRRVANAVGESALTIGRRRRLRFGRSPIHMWGVFADETISAGDFVAEYKGELISQKETDRRFDEYVARGMPDYLFKIDANLFCDATLKGSLARFINHSCEPNCEAKIVLHQNQKRIALYALRDIVVGEELCYDYKFPIEEGAENKIPCNCGAKRCRKVMN